MVVAREGWTYAFSKTAALFQFYLPVFENDDTCYTKRKYEEPEQHFRDVEPCVKVPEEFLLVKPEKKH